MPFIENSGGVGGGGSGTVTQVSSANAAIAVATGTTTPVLTAGTLDVIATAGPPAAAVAMNAKKITGLAAATVATDAASLANTLDQFGAPAANVAFNAKKITGLANAAAATDAAAFGQVVPVSTVTTKGDLIAATGNAAVARVAIGADGTRPTADANSAAGVLWAAPFAEPSYISTIFYGSQADIGSAGGGFVLNTLYAVPMFISKRVAFDRIALRCGAGTATLVVRLGIYSDAGGPGTLILDAGTVDGASGSADKTITIAQTLDAGVYWLAGSAQVAATIGGSFTANKAGSSSVITPGVSWRADSAVTLSRSFFRAGITGAFTNLVPAAADFASSQEGYGIRLRAA